MNFIWKLEGITLLAVQIYDLFPNFWTREEREI